MSESDSFSSDSRRELLLGKPTDYVFHYDPGLLHAIPRAPMREALAIDPDNLPFSGVDQWNAYEFSWLNSSGKPCVAIARFTFAADSAAMVESKSFKLYLNSFNQTSFDNSGRVLEALIHDLGSVVEAPVKVELEALDTTVYTNEASIASVCLDAIDVVIEDYQPNPGLLCVGAAAKPVRETLHSHLLRSMCPVTGQPDWGSVFIRYEGPAIDRASLLQYIVSFRNCQEFHEQCVERMYSEIKRYCQPHQLTVFAQYLRRGGLDINPFRSDCAEEPQLTLRLSRQ